MEARTEPVAGVTAISLHPAPTVSPAVACSSNKRFAAAVAEPEFTSSDDTLPPNSKKRRKQSHPIRIPTPTSSTPPVVQDEGEVEEAEEGELQNSAYLMQPRQMENNGSNETAYPATMDIGTAYTSSVRTLLPSLLSFPPHFLLPMLPTGPTPNPTAAPPPRIFNLEAYCELCSKEFCNKYFLKTHKANRHGIYVQSGDTPPTSTTPLPSASSSSPTVQTPPAVKPGAAAKLASDPKASCDTCHKKFNHEHSVKRHKAKVHWGESADGTSESNADEASRPPYSPSNILKSESANVEPVVEEHPPPSTSPLSPGRLRRLGVINADAFCEICSKEYCNKYFLKTHKLKRHGIIVRDTDDIKPDFTPLSSNKTKTWEQGAVNIQTSPLNLTVHEQATCSNSSDSGVLRTEQGVKQEASSPRPDSRDLSEDLQKLQTMLLQLNALNGTSVSCEGYVVPSQQEDTSTEPQETKFENGAAGDASPDGSPVSPAQPVVPPVQESGEEYSSPLIAQYKAEEQGATPPRQLDTEDPEIQSGGNVPFSTSCYCDICNKELCNKYFKKVHMQKMHGIEIKDNALSGGVPCDICHKQLCSKYFVRVHKQNTHGIVDLSAPTPPNSGRGSAGSPQDAPTFPQHATSPTETVKISEGADLSHRYFTHFNVVCPLCSRRFRSAKWLKAHLLNDHAEAGVEIARELDAKPKGPNNNSKQVDVESSEVSASVPKESGAPAPMLSNLLRCGGSDEHSTSYHCSYCNFSTTVLSLLFVHERSHTGLGSSTVSAPTLRSAFTCRLCFKNFSQNDLLQRHLRTHQMAGLQVNEDPQPVEENAPTQTNEERGHSAGRYRCAHCHQRFRTRDLWSAHMLCHTKRDEQEQQQSQSAPFCCPLCPFTNDSLNTFKKHVKQDHWVQQEGLSQLQPSDESRLWRSLAHVEVSRTLQDATRESQVPATYAVPRAPSDHFIMQPFLLEEPPDSAPVISETATTASCSDPEPTAAATSSTDGTFVPSLVFLPVREKVSGTLTVSFTLTPA